MDICALLPLWTERPMFHTSPGRYMLILPQFSHSAHGSLVALTSNGRCVRPPNSVVHVLSPHGAVFQPRACDVAACRSICLSHGWGADLRAGDSEGTASIQPLIPFNSVRQPADSNQLEWEQHLRSQSGLNLCAAPGTNGCVQPALLKGNHHSSVPYYFSFPYSKCNSTIPIILWMVLCIFVYLAGTFLVIYVFAW